MNRPEVRLDVFVEYDVKIVHINKITPTEKNTNRIPIN